MFVTNKWDKDVKAEFEFKWYDFPKGKTVEVSEDCARHIFGFDQEDKLQNMIRLGWIRTNNDFEESIKIYEHFVFSHEPPRRNHSTPPVVERVPLPTARKAEGNVQEAA